LTYEDSIEAAVSAIRDLAPGRPTVGIILGSGLSGVADRLEDAAAIPYQDIPGFSRPTVPGHRGTLLLGRLGGVRAVVMLGRLHYYEGYSMGEVALPVHVMARLGAGAMVATCAAGGLKAGFRRDDIVAVADHDNFMGGNPLIGLKTDRSRFVDMRDAYDPALRALLREAAGDIGLALKEGVYAAVHGPSYETPAEVEALAAVADIVGMSLVPEVIAARYCGMAVAGLAVTTNAHPARQGIEHDDVLDVAGRNSDAVGRLILGLIDRLYR
jgi:purine-nucleoside phosphorylase